MYRKANAKIMKGYPVTSLLVVSILSFIFGVLGSWFTMHLRFSQYIPASSCNLKTVQSDLMLCNENKGKIISSTHIQYPVPNLRASSPYFEGKYFDVITWQHRGSIFKQYKIDLPSVEAASRPMTISVWDYINIPNEKQVFFHEDNGAISTSDNYTYTSVPALNNTKYGIFWLKSEGFFDEDLRSKKNISSTHTIFVDIVGYSSEKYFSFSSSAKQIQDIIRSIIY